MDISTWKTLPLLQGIIWEQLSDHYHTLGDAKSTKLTSVYYILSTKPTSSAY
jgi:hypothetical protein